MRSLALSSLIALTVIACSSSDASSPSTPGTTPPGETPPGQTPPSTTGDTTTISADETWADGKTIDGNTIIAEGVKVEIADGATVTVASKVKLTVNGTLHNASTATHAKLTGTGWSGITVGKTGVVDVDGLDIDNPNTGFSTDGGSVVTLLNSSLTASVPFSMNPGSKMTVTKSNISGTSQVTIAGTFVASYMDYKKTTSDGLTLNDPDGTMTISDSKLHGAGDGDFVISSVGKMVKVEYTEITGAHCGFHFDDVGQYTIDHVSDNTNAYGAMLYGSGSGPNTITYSNFANDEWNFRMTGTNGPTTIDHTFVGGIAQNAYQNGVLPQNAPGAPNADAKPR